MKNKILPNSLCYIKGCSATGKGTRISQLLTFFIDRGDDYKILHRGSTEKLVLHRKTANSRKDWTPNMDKRFPMGVLFPRYNILFAGRMAKSYAGGLVSWNSLDYFVSQTNMKATDLMRIYGTRRNLIIDGAATATLSKNSPIDAVTMWNMDNAMFMYVFHKSYLTALGRVIQRTGNAVKGTFWQHQIYFEKELAKALEWQKNNQEHNLKLVSITADAPITHFGTKYLRFIGLKNMVDEFLDYSEDNNTLRSCFTPEVQNSILVRLYGEFKDKMKATEVTDESKS